MTSHSLESILCELESLPLQLQGVAEFTDGLEALSRAPALLTALRSAESQLPGRDVAKTTLRTRNAFVQLQTALTTLETRLQSERNSLLLQLRELTIQEEWVHASRQIT